MKRRRIYILPTRFGLMYIVGAFVMILVGSAYQNNLVNMLAFFMLSLIFVSMIQTHGNLKDVRAESLESEGGFAGATFLLTTVLTNESKLPRHNLESRARRMSPVSVYENRQALPERGTLKLRASYSAAKRGRHQARGARVSTVYPLGLFEAWTWFDEIVTDYFVYPAPRGELPLPSTPIPARGSTQSGTSRGADDFQGHRKFQNGDSYHHIDWKARARGRPMLSKEFIDEEPSAVILDWSSLSSLDREARLSQLSKWVDEAKTRKQVFGLRLPGIMIAPDQGSSHAVRCWETLATFEIPKEES